MSNYILKKTLLTEDEIKLMWEFFNRSIAGEGLSSDEQEEWKRLAKMCINRHKRKIFTLFLPITTNNI